MAEGPLTGLLSKSLKRSLLLPVGKDKETGDIQWALPEAVVSLLHGIEFPGKAMRGEVDVMDPNTGHASDQAIARMADVADIITLGAAAMPQQKGAVLRAGARGTAKKAGKEVAEEGAQKGIRAYHGSPHDFDKFQMDKIGTGEGAQAYGHGLYFADNEGVALGYRDALSSPVAENITDFGEDELRRRIDDWIDEIASHKGTSVDEVLSDPDVSLERMRREIIDEMLIEKNIEWFDEPLGRMYEVNIKANPDDFLDWDKPLREQPQKVRDAFGFTNGPDIKEQQGLIAKLQAEGIGEIHKDPRYIAMEKRMDDATRAEASFREAKLVGRDDAGRLSNSGVKGIKYLDQGSRVTGMRIVSPDESVSGKWVVGQAPNGPNEYFDTEAAAKAAYEKAFSGSHNYVVFDDKLIEIVKKYGIVAAIGAGLMTQEQGDAMAAEGFPMQPTVKRGAGGGSGY